MVSVGAHPDWTWTGTETWTGSRSLCWLSAFWLVGSLTLCSLALLLRACLTCCVFGLGLDRAGLGGSGSVLGCYLLRVCLGDEWCSLCLSSTLFILESLRYCLWLPGVLCCVLWCDLDAKNINCKNGRRIVRLWCLVILSFELCLLCLNRCLFPLSFMVIYFPSCCPC